MLELAEISVEYRSSRQRIVGLQQLSLRLEEPQIYTLIGATGCGKSTLLHLLSGLLAPAAGKILQDGKLWEPRKHRIGLVPQQYGLLPWRTARENMLLGCRIQHKPIDEALFGTLVTALQLSDLLERYPHTLSGGQQQRVAIARAFLLQPELLLMDEPFSALDALTRESLQQLFLTLWRAHPALTIFVTHSIEEAIYLGQEILVLSSLPEQTIHCLPNPGFSLARNSHSSTYFQMEQCLHQHLEAGRA